MNCINHPDQPRAAFCQQCGKPLCEACSRQVGNAIFCEPCLLARVSPPPAAAFTPGAIPIPPSSAAASPFLAGVLGFIPGVGAMYNGQFIKAMVHILVFVMLVVLTDHVGPVGILIAGWVFYQVFDAIYTARARRDGDPLPDPFGLMKLEGEMGFGGRGNGVYAEPFAPTPYPAAETAQAGYTNPAQAGYVNPVQPLNTSGLPPMPPPSNVPVGAFVLIGMGVMFLLGSFNVFNIRLSHLAMPIFLIGLGIWLYFHKMASGGVQDDGSGYFHLYAIRRLRGPAFLMLTGVLWLLDSLHILRWHQSWGFYLLLWGVLILAERMASNEAVYYPPTVPPTTTTAAPVGEPAVEMTAEAAAANQAAAAEHESPLQHRNTTTDGSNTQTHSSGEGQE